MTLLDTRKQKYNQLCLIAAVIFCLSHIPCTDGFLSSGSTTQIPSRLSGELSGSETSTSLNYKKVFVAGGSKGVGHLIVEKLSQQGTEVVAMVRREESKEELDAMKGVTAILGDAFDQKDVENAMDGCDVAITTLGGKTGERRVDYEGNNNVIESAGILGIQRILLITSIGWYVLGSIDTIRDDSRVLIFENANDGFFQFTFSIYECFLSTLKIADRQKQLHIPRFSRC